MMNERIQELLAQAALETNQDPNGEYYAPMMAKFAELIVRECLAIAKNREDELENASLLKESNAVGVVAYRIARQFGVKE